MTMIIWVGTGTKNLLVFFICPVGTKQFMRSIKMLFSKYRYLLTHASKLREQSYDIINATKAIMFNL
jgi:hypothetical protein